MWFAAKDFFHWKETLFTKGMLQFFNESAVCETCSCQLELVLQEKDACLIVSCRYSQCFHCLFSVWEKIKVEWSFHMGWITTEGELCREVGVLEGT